MNDDADLNDLVLVPTKRELSASFFVVIHNFSFTIIEIEILEKLFFALKKMLFSKADFQFFTHC